MRPSALKTSFCFLKAKYAVPGFCRIALCFAAGILCADAINTRYYVSAPETENLYECSLEQELLALTQGQKTNWGMWYSTRNERLWSANSGTPVFVSGNLLVVASYEANGDKVDYGASHLAVVGTSVRVTDNYPIGNITTTNTLACLCEVLCTRDLSESDWRTYFISLTNMTAAGMTIVCCSYHPSSYHYWELLDDLSSKKEYRESTERIATQCDAQNVPKCLWMMQLPLSVKPFGRIDFAVRCPNVSSEGAMLEITITGRGDFKTMRLPMVLEIPSIMRKVLSPDHPTVNEPSRTILRIIGRDDMFGNNGVSFSERMSAIKQCTDLLLPAEIRVLSDYLKHPNCDDKILTGKESRLLCAAIQRLLSAQKGWAFNNEITNQPVFPHGNNMVPNTPPIKTSVSFSW